MRSLSRLFVAGCMLALAVPAQADIVFHAKLTHDQEVNNDGTPAVPVNEGSGGFATFVLNDARTRLTYDVQLFGLDLRRVDPLTGIPGPAIPGDLNPNDDALRMHIHRRVAGLNGPIVFGMIDALAVNRNDNNPNDLVIDIDGLHITGAWDLTEGVIGVGTLASEIDDLFRGELYINVHTSDHAGGEIRGQILPEPGSLALLALGLLGIVGLRRLAS